METSQVKLKGKREIVISVLTLVLGLLWMFYLGDKLTGGLQKNWQQLFGVPWYLDADWRYTSIFVLVQILPGISLFGGSLALLNRVERLNSSSAHRNNLAQLATARDALKHGISSLEVIEKEYSGKLAALEKLQSDIEALQAARSINTEELRRTLGAIEQANRFTRILQQATGFVLGILSSLVASYVWEYL